MSDGDFHSKAAGDLFVQECQTTEQEIENISNRLDEKGVHLPIKDGLEYDGEDNLSDDGDIANGPLKTIDENAETTDEERELPGVKRPKRGEGWWGIGKPLQPQRKGLYKEFVDGAGLPSPGRWRVRDRRLPDDRVARDLRLILEDALFDMERRLPGGSLRKLLHMLMGGHLTESPFPSRIWTS